jgi:hypothetical protein
MSVLNASTIKLTIWESFKPSANNSRQISEG